MKAKVKVAKKVVAEKDIVQLSGSTIINARISKCAKDLGEFKPEEICKKCKFCKWYAVAKTPFNSKYRQMDAWKSEVSKMCPCEYLKGIKNEDGELEILRGSTDATSCENFELAENRVPQKLKDIVMKARNSDSLTMSDKAIAEMRNTCKEDLKAVELQIEQVKLKLNELKSKKESVEEELEQAYTFRFNDCDELKAMNAMGYAQIVGENTFYEANKAEEDSAKLVELGFTPNQKKVHILTISSSFIAGVQQKYGKDVTYGGHFTSKNEEGLQVDILGNTLDYYAGQSFEFETELVEVAKSRGFRKQVIFQETDENFQKRQGISILDILCGNRKMRWREDVVVPATIDNMDEDEETDVEDNEEGDEE